MTEVIVGRVRPVIKGVWDIAIAYETLALVTYQKNSYIAIRDSIGKNPRVDIADWEHIGGRPTNSGDWDTTTQYYDNDIVNLGSNSYIANKDSLDKNPTSLTVDVDYWSLLGASSLYVGVWDIANGYTAGNYVDYDGKSYRALYDIVAGSQTGFNAHPDVNPSFWDLISDILVAQWSRTIAYNTVTAEDRGDIVIKESKLYMAIADSTNEDPTNPYYWQSLSSRTTPRGVWSGSIQYYTSDITTYENFSYVANKESVNQNPFDNIEYWTTIGGYPKVEGVWDSTVSYYILDIVSYGGQHSGSYIAKKDSIDKIPQGGITFWQSLGASALYYGEWNVATAYVVDDYSSFGGKTYGVIIDVTGGTNPSTNPVSWELISDIVTVEWNSLTSYNTVSAENRGDMVIRDLNLYMAIKDSINEDPLIVTNNYWDLIASNGAGVTNVALDDQGHLLLTY